MSRSLYFLTFIAGAAAGSAVAWYFVKTKYEKIAQEDFESRRSADRILRAEEAQRKEVEESYENEQKQTVTEAAYDKPSIMEYAKKLQSAGYTDYANAMNGFSGSKEDDMVRKVPYVIAPDEFGELDDYEKITLTCYSDGELADDNDEIIEDVTETVGSDFEDHFGEYEEDSVYVRNDMRECDYEILRDTRTYEEVSSNKPRQVEV